MIHVIAIITTKPGKRDEVLSHFRANVPAVHAEKGCIEYGATIDADGMGSFQTKFGADTFVVVEKWESTDALKAHGARRTWRPMPPRRATYRQPRHPRPLADLIASVSETNVADYDVDGVVCLRQQFDAALDRAHACGDRARPRLARPQRDQLRRGQQRREILRRHVHVEVRSGLPCRRARLPRSGDRRALMSSAHADFFYDQLFVKEPGTAHPTPWHQDQPYWPVKGWQIASVWIALDRSTAATARSSSSPARTAGA